MKQGNYKALILKLSGTALGLVAMLSLAANLGHNLLSDKSIHATNSDGYAYASSDAYSIKFPVAEKNTLEVAVVEQISRVADGQKWQIELELETARLAGEAVKLEHFENLLDVHSRTIETLSEAIVDIAQRVEIPRAIKENIIADLGRQLEKAEKKLSKLEDHLMKLSYKISLPHAKYDKSSTCSADEDIIVKKCDGQCAESDRKQRVTRGASKRSVEAFYWI